MIVYQAVGNQRPFEAEPAEFAAIVEAAGT